jgi:hypothetical protein
MSDRVESHRSEVIRGISEEKNQRKEKNSKKIKNYKKFVFL